VTDQHHRYDDFASRARPDESRVARSIAVTLAGLAVALGAIASIDLPTSDQELQDLLFGVVLGATYAVTVLSVRVFGFAAVGPGLSLLLSMAAVVWFVGLQHQFAFAATTVFAVGLLLAVGLAAALRDSVLWVGTLLVAIVGMTIAWLLFNYLDPRIVLLTGINGSGADRLLGNGMTFLAAVGTAAITIRWLARRDSPGMS